MTQDVRFVMKGGRDLQGRQVVVRSVLACAGTVPQVKADF